MKKLLLILLPIIIVSLFIYLYLHYTQKSPISPNISQAPSVKPGSKIYEAKDLGFTITIPDEYSVENNGPYSRLILKKTQQPSMGPGNFIYISVIPKDREKSEEVFYNYNPRDFQLLKQAQPGSKVSLGEPRDPNLASYFTYERIDDLMLGGFGAKAFKNSKPWEFPPGTAEYRYLVEFEPAVYIIGAYVGNTQNKNEINKQDVDVILSTLKITPDSIKNDRSKPVTEGVWQNFSSAEHDITFEYPSGWDRVEDSQNFQNGDILALRAIGQTQRTQTELYDGVSFAAMKPITTSDNLALWVKEQYSDSTMNPDSPPQFSQVTFGGIVYEKAYVCGLGCFTYLHTKQNGKIYGFVYLVEGPHAASYESTISRIMSSVKYTD